MPGRVTYGDSNQRRKEEKEFWSQDPPIDSDFDNPPDFDDSNDSYSNSSNNYFRIVYPTKKNRSNSINDSEMNIDGDDGTYTGPNSGTGEGKFIAENYEYEGYFIDSSKNGRGKMTFYKNYPYKGFDFKKDDTLEGKWKHKLQGYLKLTRKEEEIILYFENNYIHSEYTGDFNLNDNFEPSGKGKEEIFDLLIYEGNFKYGVYDGEGVITFLQPPDLYSGYQFEKGDILEGVWEYGKLNGEYKLTSGNDKSILILDNNKIVSQYEGKVYKEFIDGPGTMTYYQDTPYGSNYKFLKGDKLYGEWEEGVLKNGQHVLDRKIDRKNISFNLEVKDKQIKESSWGFQIGGYRKTKRKKKKCRKNKLSRKKKKCRKNKLSRKKKKNKKRTQRR